MHSIKRQTFILFFIISFGLISSLLITMHTEIKKSTIPLNQSITQQFVDSKTQEINSWFGERIAELAILSDATNRTNFTKAAFFAETAALETREKENYVSLRLVSFEGISQSSVYPDFSIQNRNYYLDLRENPLKNYTVSDLVVSREDDQPIVIILYRLAKQLEDGTSYIAAAVPLQKVMELAEDLTLYDGHGALLSSDSERIKIDEKNEMLFSSSLDLLPDWEVNYIINKKSLTKSSLELQKLLLIISFIVLIILALLLFFLMRGIVQPILKLKETMVQVQQGNRQIRASVNTTNEIGELADSFNHTLSKVYENEESYRKASIRLMQEQIQPHFLYNTLDTIQWLILGESPKEAVTAIENLSVFFRRGLNNGHEITTVKEELEHVRSYLAIQQLRHEELAQVRIDCPIELEQLSILHFILQPLIENALQYGVRPAGRLDGKISVAVKQRNDAFLEIQIRNTGKLISDDSLKRVNQPTNEEARTSGFGILNIRRRLKLLYGENAQLFYSRTETETVAQLIIPIKKWRN